MLQIETHFKAESVSRTNHHNLEEQVASSGSIDKINYKSGIKVAYLDHFP